MSICRSSFFVVAEVIYSLSLGSAVVGFLKEGFYYSVFSSNCDAFFLTKQELLPLEGLLSRTFFCKSDFIFNSKVSLWIISFLLSLWFYFNFNLVSFIDLPNVFSNFSNSHINWILRIITALQSPHYEDHDFTNVVVLI